MKAIVRILIAAFGVSFLLAGGAAQAQNKPKLTGNLIEDIKASTGRPNLTGDAVMDLQKALDAKLLPDLQYALKLATSSGSKVTAPCYQAWIDIINTQEAAVQTKNPDGSTTETPLPDPHIITTFERLVELRNALQPESDFMIKCSPVASMVRKDIVGFLGTVISGGAGIATLMPGL